MKLDRACSAQPGHKEYQRFHIGFRPVVLSSDRFNGIVSRANQDEQREQQAAFEEQQRYNQYLKDGSDALCKYFTNMTDLKGKDDDEVQASRDKALAEAAKDQEAAIILEEMRKERIIRANRILQRLKPGPRALHQALLGSETIHQRNYHQALKHEIAEDARRQQLRDEKQCPELLIPFGHVTEQQEKAQQLAKAKAMHDYHLQDLEARRQRQQADKEQDLFDCIVEREQYKCMQDKEEKAAKELAVRKREFCRRAYKDALKEKEEKTNYERMCDQIEDRIICVDRTTERNMKVRYNKQMTEMRAKRTQNLEAQAVKLCREQQTKERQLQELQAANEERGHAAIQMDEARRLCEIKQLSKQRRDYELEERKHRDDHRLRQAEIRRYEIAMRYKNEEANRYFKATAKRKQDKITSDLREVLHGQRQQFLDQRQQELMRTTACDEDPYLKDDVDFFDGAVQIMQDSREIGRPLYPIAKAAEQYRRENQLDMVPEGQMVRRSKRRDKCWPGYFSKAVLAYKKYEHREKCRQDQEKERHKLFDNCIKITKMAAEERPYKKCAMECPMECFQHRGMPAMESVSSFEPPGFICHEVDPPAKLCPVVRQEKPPPCKKCDENIGDCVCPSIMEVMEPGEEYPPSETRTASIRSAQKDKVSISNMKSVAQKASLSKSQRVSGGKQRSDNEKIDKEGISNVKETKYEARKESPLSKTSLSSSQRVSGGKQRSDYAKIDKESMSNGKEMMSIAKKETPPSIPSPTNSHRFSAGNQPSVKKRSIFTVASTGPKPILKNPDLSHYWTSKRQAPDTAKVSSTGIPQIDNPVDPKVSSIGIPKTANRKLKTC